MIKVSDLIKEYYRSGEIGKMIGRTTRTVQIYADKGYIDSYLVNNRRVYPRQAVIDYLESVGMIYDDSEQRDDVAYARVSGHGKKEDLERQKNRLKDYALMNNSHNFELYSDIASGLNDKRKGLRKLMKRVMNGEINRIYITYKDRLTRFGFHYFQTLCDHYGTEIIVIDDVDDTSMEQELAEDIVSIIQLFSGKLYGMRSRVKKNINDIL